MKRKRYNHLDAIRGISAISVVVFHYTLDLRNELDYTYIGKIYFDILDNYFDLGKWGVIMFFLLSGMVIPFSIKGHTIKDIKKFWVSRVFRLYPVYWVSVILGFILFERDVLTTLVNFSMFQQFFGIENVIGLYWTLQIELVFYFLVAFGFYFKLVYNPKGQYYASIIFVSIALVLSIFRYYLEVKFPVALPLSISVMFIGSIWSNYVLATSAKDAKMYLFKLARVFIPIFILTCYFGYSKNFGFHENPLKYVLTYLAGIASFFLFSQLFRINKGIFVFLGQISYSLYLFHPLTWRFYEIMNVKNNVVLFVASLLTAIVISKLLYEYVEKKGVILGRKVKEKL